MTRDELVEKMAKAAYESSFHVEPRSWVTAKSPVRSAFIVDAISMLQVVLDNIDEVVEVVPSCHALSCHGEMEVALKPKFRKK